MFLPFLVSKTFQDDESESTETFSLRTNQVLDPATLASPDLLSDMSDVKMSTILCVEQMEQTPHEERAEAIALEGSESFGFLEQFNDRLDQDKVHKSLNSEQDLQPGCKEQTKIVEIHHTAVVEPRLQEMYTGEKTSSRSAAEVKDMTGMISHLSVDMDQYLEETAIVTHGSQQDLVQDKFEQVIVKRDGKRRPPDIKKPIRKKLRDRQRSGCSSSEGELERVSSEESLDGDVILNENTPAASMIMEPPASPLVVDTPLGSIKDRVRALQDKVEEEAEQKSTQKQIPPAKSSFITKKMEADMPLLPRVPISPKSPRSQTERLEETMSVKDLLKAFQTGQDPSKNKTGLFEHKPLATGLTSISGSSDTEQDPKSQTQTHDVKDFQQQQQHDDQTFDRTDTVEKPVDQKQELLSPERNTAKRGDLEYVCLQEEAPEVPESETLSVKERAKTFQFGQDPKPEHFDHKPVAGYTENIQVTEQSSSEEPESQPQYPDISITDIKASEKTNGDQMPGLAGECSEDSHSATVEKTVRFTDIVISDDGSVVVATDLKETPSVKELMKAFQSDQAPLKSKLKPLEHTTSEETLDISSDIIHSHDKSVQSKEPELLGGNLSRMKLEEPSLSIGQGLPEDMQISPDRRPSEDFSADIKAELEESPEYQLFKQASTTSDVSYHLRGEGDSLFDTQIKVNDQSPGSPKQEVLAEPSTFIEKDESDKTEGPVLSGQTATQILPFSSSRESLSETINEYSTVTEEITESQVQEIYIQRETPTQGSGSGVKDMSGMLSLLSTDLDECIQASPEKSTTPEEEIIHETFEEIVIKKSRDKELAANSADENDGSSMFLETDQVGEDHSKRWREGELENKKLLMQKEPMEGKTMKLKDATSMISLMTADLEHDMDRPLSVRFPAEHAIQRKIEGISLIPQTLNEEQRTVCEITQEQATSDVKDTRSEETPERTALVEILPKSEPEMEFQTVCISQKTQHQVASPEKNIAGVVALLTSELDECLNENYERKQSPVEDSFVHEICKEDTRTGISEDRTAVEENKQMQTELSTSPVSETPFQEDCSKRNTQQLQSVITRDISGMLSLLTSDLDEYLQEHPLAIPNNQEEQAVCDTYEEVVLRKEHSKKETLSPELHAMSLEKIHLDTEDLEKTALDSGIKAGSMEVVSVKCIPSEEDEVETTIHIEESYLTGDHKTDDSDEGDFAHSEKHTLLQHLSSSETPRRPVELESLNIVVPDDPAKEPCHPDSLEGSPQVEDRSSRTTPDSIEPGPGRESPCPDSLESSPTQTNKADLQMPARAAVYEDYASQLEACFVYDKDIYKNESEEEQEENTHVESNLEQDKHLESSNGENVDVTFSEPKLCSSETLHILMRQDSQDKDEEEENDFNKQLTPEEKMFKMAAKIKTFEEMEQEEKVKSDSTVPLETDLSHHDDDSHPEHVTDLGHTFNSEANVNLIIQREEIHTELKTIVEDSLCSGTDRAEHDLKMGETTVQESLTLTPDGEKDEPFNLETEAAGQISLEEERTPVMPPGVKSPDPFQFQEGKLFEMTRGGAIDMTGRRFEGDECAFFHMGELPSDENMPGEEDQQRSDSATDSNLQVQSSPSEDDKIPSSINTMFVKPSCSSETPLSTVDLGSSTEVQLGSPDGPCENLGLEYFQSTIADLQTDPSITVNFLDSMQRQPSSDSSDDDDDDEEEQEDEEDPCSVIESSSTAVQSNMQPDFQVSSRIETIIRTKQETMKELHVHEVERKGERKSTVDQRSRSEADNDTSKTPITEGRSYSDSCEPTDRSDFLPSNLSVTKPQNAPTLEERNDVEISQNAETSLRSPDTGDISSSSHKSPDSVIFTYDIPTSHSSDSDYNPLLVVKPSSGTEDVFQSQSIQDDMVKTLTQMITDDQTTQCTSGMARLIALPGPLLSFFPLTVRLHFIFQGI